MHDPDIPQCELPDGEDRARRIATAVEDHGEWLFSEGHRGKRFDVAGRELSGVDLREADLSGVDLRQANLAGAVLLETDLRFCRLDFAHLTGTTGLLARQIAGADLTGCRLPATLNLAAPLEQVNDQVISARKTLLALILAIGYLWLTIGTTTDVDLLTNSASSPLPIINTPISFTGFFLAAPLLLLGTYLYFHIQQQRLWEVLSGLPARFPDGRTLEQHSLPWLLTGLVHAHSPHLGNSRPAMSRLQNAIAIAIAWYAVPMTLAAVWLRFAPRHDWIGTLYHGSLLSIAIVAGVMLYNQTVTTLSGTATRRHGPRLPSSPGVSSTLALTELIAVATALVLVPIISWGMLSPSAEEPPSAAAHPQLWVPRLMAVLGYRTHADFHDMDVSVRPTEWSNSNPPLDRVRGANLRGADAVRAFLANAQLQSSDLVGADLESADLRGAQLADADITAASLLLANLQGADLADARLDGAQLIGARLQGASLVRAQVRNAYLNRAELGGADLSQADLGGAQLHGADLQGANLDRSILAGAALEGVDLRGALGLSCAQVMQARHDEETRLPHDLQCW